MCGFSFLPARADAVPRLRGVRGKQLVVLSGPSASSPLCRRIRILNRRQIASDTPSAGWVQPPQSVPQFCCAVFALSAQRHVSIMADAPPRRGKQQAAQSAHDGATLAPRRECLRSLRSALCRRAVMPHPLAPCHCTSVPLSAEARGGWRSVQTTLTRVRLRGEALATAATWAVFC